MNRMIYSLLFTTTENKFDRFFLNLVLVRNDSTILGRAKNRDFLDAVIIFSLIPFIKRN